MARTIITIIVLAMLPFVAASCNKAEETDQVRVKRPAVQKKAAPEEQLAPKAEEHKEGDELRLRNPFQSHLVVMRGVEGAKKIKGPLECCELSAFKLVAVVVGVGEDSGFALIQAPDGKRYVIRRGDVLGTREGKVVKLTPRSVVVRETIRDEDGKVKSSEEMELGLLEKQK